MSEKIRKQVYLLTAKDLADHPLWEFCSDEECEEGQDEATVKPSEDKEVPGYSPGAYIVAADVTFHDGTHALGYVYSGTPEDLGCTQPIVLSEEAQVNFWFGSMRYNPNWKEHLSTSLRLLGRASESLFPISFETKVPVNGAPLKIVLAGFMVRDNDQNIVILKEGEG